MKTKEFEFDGITVYAYRSKIDGKTVIGIEGPDDDSKTVGLGDPDLTIYVNEAMIYKAGEVGDDLR